MFSVCVCNMLGSTLIPSRSSWQSSHTVNSLHSNDDSGDGNGTTRIGVINTMTAAFTLLSVLLEFPSTSLHGPVHHGIICTGVASNSLSEGLPNIVMQEGVEARCRPSLYQHLSRVVPNGTKRRAPQSSHHREARTS